MLKYCDYIDDYGTLFFGTLQIICLLLFIFNILNITIMKLRIIHEHLCNFWLWRLITMTPKEGFIWQFKKEYGHTIWYEQPVEKPALRIKHTVLPDGTVQEFSNN